MYNNDHYRRRSPPRSPPSPRSHFNRAAYAHSNPPPPPSAQQGHPPPRDPYRDHRPSSSSRDTVNGYSPVRSRDGARSASTFFDPMAEAREQHRQGWQPSAAYPQHSPRAHHQDAPYPPSGSDRGSYDRGPVSPTTASHSHNPHPSSHYPHHSPYSHQDDQPRSPSHSRNYSSSRMGPPPPAAAVAASPDRPLAAPPPPPQRSDPMSLSSILSSSAPAPPRQAPPPPQPPVVTKAESPTLTLAQPILPESPNYPIHKSRDSDHRSSRERMSDARREPEAGQNGVGKHESPPPKMAPLSSREPERKIADTIEDEDEHKDKARVNGDSGHHRTPSKGVPTPAPRPKLVIAEKDLQAAHKEIEADLSDIETGDFEQERKVYQKNAARRFHVIADLEESRRKRRRIAYIHRQAIRFSEQSAASKEHYVNARRPAIQDEVQQRDQADEKERKKVAQRNRRWENSKQRAEQQVKELNAQVENAGDQNELDKLLKERSRASEKIIRMDKQLRGEPIVKEPKESSPAVTVDHSFMGSFQTNEEEAQDPPKKRIKTGGRPKKSKEEKQRQKDAAAAAYEQGEEPLNILPKSETTASKLKKEARAAAEEEKLAEKAEKASKDAQKQYDYLYEKIWRDLANKDIPKLFRIKESSLSVRQSNLRKTAQLASKEARRWQLKTNKSTKDTQARAKRAMREMLNFWKRNERDERDQRKMAEKQELEAAKRAEAEREANRQKRKLNFLISQTELYSHFIGKKVKTDELERSTDDVTASGETIKDAPASSITDLIPAEGKAGAKVTNFEDLDFDNEDESALQEAAMANAQNAIQEAQDRARAFNDGQMADFDEGEMNFQNPTSLQTIDIAQPSMLQCQLKEYQLKGLNWLVNLYEQGINGILADEMGLGKTVQSISVMAYLAEQHNIWGPFLVIAPASTLHNWQQEITRFVPALKTLPYWGSAKDRKVLRKFWDRKHITYAKDSPFHVLVTSYQLVVMDAQYFQKIRWQYMILDEAQAIKSSQSSRWKSLLGFHCRNRLLLTGTPIQNSMQELWALLHFIMPSLFDSHDEFSEWFSKDIESHAQSNTKLNEDQLRRLHMILKPFMLRRIKKHVQKELGDKVEKDVFCDLTYRQRAYYSNLRNKISILDLIEKAAIGDDQDTATLMNLVMQFRKVCNHPDLFERADTTSPVSFGYFAETASFLREGSQVEVVYSVRSHIELLMPRLIGRNGGRLDLPGPDNEVAGWRRKFLLNDLNIFTAANVLDRSKGNGGFSWLPLADTSPAELAWASRNSLAERAIDLASKGSRPFLFETLYPNDGEDHVDKPIHSMLNIVRDTHPVSPALDSGVGPMHELCNVSSSTFYGQGLNALEPGYRPAVCAPPAELYCASQGLLNERRQTLFDPAVRRALYPTSAKFEEDVIDRQYDPALVPAHNMLPEPISCKAKYTRIQVPSMRRFVTDSGKLAKLDRLLAELKEGGHRVLLYFQMTRMIDLMEEYLTYRNYKYCRLDGSTKLEDRRDTVADFQTRPDIFVFLLSTRAGGLGINLTAADTVIFYDSDWNPTIDSQAMDRAHRLGQTRQVTVYRLITRGTIEERIRKRALQKEEVQRVVISGGAGAGVDFNTRSRENRTKDIAMWLADDDQAAEIEKREAEVAEQEAKDVQSGKKKKPAQTRKKIEVSLDDMYHEGEGHFDDNSKHSGTATPVDAGAPSSKKRKGTSKKAKTIKEKLAYVDGGV